MSAGVEARADVEALREQLGLPCAASLHTQAHAIGIRAMRAMIIGDVPMPPMFGARMAGHADVERARSALRGDGPQLDVAAGSGAGAPSRQGPAATPIGLPPATAAEVAAFRDARLAAARERHERAPDRYRPVGARLGPHLEREARGLGPDFLAWREEQAGAQAVAQRRATRAAADADERRRRRREQLARLEGQRREAEGMDPGGPAVRTLSRDIESIRAELGPGGAS